MAVIGPQMALLIPEIVLIIVAIILISVVSGLLIVMGIQRIWRRITLTPESLKEEIKEGILKSLDNLCLVAGQLSHTSLNALQAEPSLQRTLHIFLAWLSIAVPSSTESHKIADLLKLELFFEHEVPISLLTYLIQQANAFAEPGASLQERLRSQGYVLLIYLLRHYSQTNAVCNVSCLNEHQQDTYRNYLDEKKRLPFTFSCSPQNPFSQSADTFIVEVATSLNVSDAHTKTPSIRKQKTYNPTGKKELPLLHYKLEVLEGKSFPTDREKHASDYLKEGLQFFGKPTNRPYHYNASPETERILALPLEVNKQNGCLLREDLRPLLKELKIHQVIYQNQQIEQQEQKVIAQAVQESNQHVLEEKEEKLVFEMEQQKISEHISQQQILDEEKECMQDMSRMLSEAEFMERIKQAGFNTITTERYFRHFGEEFRRQRGVSPAYSENFAEAVCNSGGLEINTLYAMDFNALPLGVYQKSEKNNDKGEFRYHPAMETHQGKYEEFYQASMRTRLNTGGKDKVYHNFRDLNLDNLSEDIFSKISLEASLKRDVIAFIAEAKKTHEKVKGFYRIGLLLRSLADQGSAIFTQIFPYFLKMKEKNVSCQVSGWSKYETHLLGLVTEQLIKANLKDVKRLKTQLEKLENFSDKELHWFTHLVKASNESGSFEEFVNGTSGFFNFMKAHNITLGDDPNLYLKEELSSGNVFHQLIQITTCITKASARKIQIQWLPNLPEKSVEAVKVLSELKYMAVHEAMYVVTKTGLGSTCSLLNFYLPEHIRKNEWVISPSQLRETQTTQWSKGREWSSDSKKPYVGLCLRAIYLRFCAYHLRDPKVFEESIELWEKETGTKLSDCPKFKQDQSNIQEFNEKIEAAWERIKAKVLTLEETVRKEPVEEAKEDYSKNPANKILEENKLRIPCFNKTDIETLLKSFPSLSEKETNWLRDSLIAISGTPEDLKSISQEQTYALQAAHLVAKGMEHVKDQLKICFSPDETQQNLAYGLAIFRQLFYQESYRRSTKTPRQGKWMRLNQALIVLLAWKTGRIFQAYTSEGKTMTIQAIILGKVYQFNKAEVITHNETLAKDAATEISNIATQLGLKVTKPGDPLSSIDESDINYIPIQEKVLNKVQRDFDFKDNYTILFKYVTQLLLTDPIPSPYPTKEDFINEKLKESPHYRRFIQEKLLEQERILSASHTKESNESKEEKEEKEEKDNVSDSASVIQSQTERKLTESDCKQLLLNTVEKNLPQNKVVVVDELDEVTVYIPAKTALRLAHSNGGSSEFSPQGKAFLIDMAHIMKACNEDLTCTSKEQVMKFFKEKLPLIYENEDKFSKTSSEYIYYKKVIDNSETFEKWVMAFIAAYSLVFKESFTLEREIIEDGPSSMSLVHIRLVHYDTTGRIDQKSQLAEGVHSALGAIVCSNPEAYGLKKDEAKCVVIPDLSTVLAEGSVSTILQEEYHERYGFSGTIGDPNSLKEKAIQKALNISSQNTLRVPHAKKDFPGETGEWPIVVEEAGNPDSLKIKYSRNYHLLREVVPKRTMWWDVIFEILIRSHRAGHPVVVIFNTILECEEFSDRLASIIEKDKSLKITPQIFYDAAENKERFMPSESHLIEWAGKENMVTAGSTAIGRGTDLSTHIKEGFILVNASFGLADIAIQKLNRVGRNGEIGTCFEVYCFEDILKAFQVKDVTTLLSIKEIQAVLHLPIESISIDKMEEKEEKKEVEARDKPEKKVEREVIEYFTWLNEHKTVPHSLPPKVVKFLQNVLENRMIETLNRKKPIQREKYECQIDFSKNLLKWLTTQYAALQAEKDKESLEGDEKERGKPNEGKPIELPRKIENKEIEIERRKELLLNEFSKFSARIEEAESINKIPEISQEYENFKKDNLKNFNWKVN